MIDKATLAEDAGHILFWQRAVDLQARRATDAQAETRDAEVDTYLFAVALRQLVRAVELCEAHASRVISVALNDFKSNVPGWLNVRDVIEHFDEYRRGEGRLQRAGVFPVSLLEWFEFDGTSRTLHIPPHYLDVDQARSEAEILSTKALEGLHEA